MDGTPHAERMRARRIAGALAVATLMASGLVSGCSSTGCASWVDVGTPADAARAADAVVIGTVDTRIGSAQLLGGAPLGRIEVDSWIAGAGDEVIEVASLIDHCGDSRDQVGEAMGDGPRMLFLSDVDGVWATLTPFAGVAVPAVDGDVPKTWTAG